MFKKFRPLGRPLPSDRVDVSLDLEAASYSHAGAALAYSFRAVEDGARVFYATRTGGYLVYREGRRLFVERRRLKSGALS